MEKKLSYGWMLSLKEICLRRVTVILWSQTYTLASINYDYIEVAVIGDMRKLELPPLLAEQMTYLVDPIQLETTKWKEFHESYLDIKCMDIHILQQFCWTNLGTVDFRKSAEKLIRYEMFDIIKCYKLSCFYCLHDNISVLWEKLPEESKRHFYDEKEPSRDSEPPLEFCWPYILKGEETKLNIMLERPFGNPTTFNQYAFEYSAYEGNKAATEYFFLKLTDVEREVSLLRTVQAVLMRRMDDIILFHDLHSLYTRSETFCYLLFLMSTEQQMEIFKEYPFTVLMKFLEWPWQDIALDISELIWPYLTAEEYADALRMISSRTKSGFNLTKLFQELFLHGSSDFRKHFVDLECRYDASFRSFFKVQDSETIKIIFRAVDSEDRKRLVYSRRVLKHFYKSILRGKCDMVELCVQEANLSKEDREGFKRAFYIFFTEIERERRRARERLSLFIWHIVSWKDEEGQKEDPSGSLTETEVDARYINRREYIWEQFLRIVDEGNAKTPCTRSLEEEERGYSSSNSDFEYI
ncbi:hypothetical protein AVEN_152306-1 [Araneus ventricosus]|uniref:Uncharacterized protein n=1 Tax=Araneus ventricosus TaxID=182803 RepID=A0A4Y2KK57_ARAVE|nr:hypothetical protein AVEN_152306-1 [Araneus ventricosus]